MHPRHPKKEVNAALDYAGSRRLTVERTAAGHEWGRIICACGAWVSVWSTPRSSTGVSCGVWVDQHIHPAEEETT